MSRAQATWEETAIDVLTAPLAEPRAIVESVMSWKDYWMDVQQRYRYQAHVGTIVVGILLCLVSFAYVGVVSVDGHSSDNNLHVFHAYVASMVCIIGAFQGYYTVAGISIENEPLLLVANFNALALLARLLVTASLNEVLVPLKNWMFLGFVAALVVAHMVLSYLAWNGDFSRFTMFSIGNNGRIRKLFKQYEMWDALSWLDMQVSIMVAMTLFLFTSVVWWHYVVVTLLFLLNIVLRQLLRAGVRKEQWFYFKLATPVSVLLPGAYVLALTFHKDVSLVNFPPACEKLAWMTASLFMVTRAAMIMAAWNCSMNFGGGLAEALRTAKAPHEFFVSGKHEMLLQPGEKPPEEEGYSIRFASSQQEE